MPPHPKSPVLVVAVDLMAIQRGFRQLKADAGRGFLGAVEMLDHYWRVVELP